MRTFIASLLVCLLPVSAPVSDLCSAAPPILAKSAALLADSGEWLLEQDADLILPIASTTKIMTALVVLERCSPEEEVLVTQDCCGIEGSSMYLRPGERYTVRELLTGLLLVSGNDAATALALHCAGSVDGFAGLMNRKAVELGLEHSHFTNPHGLNEAGHYSTAHDLALLMRAAMREEGFAELCGLNSAQIGAQTLINHNKLLERYPGCIAGKTGYTELAGRCLVSCAERDGTRLICVTLSDPDDWNDHEKLYDWAFSSYRTLVVDADSSRVSVPLFGGNAAFAHASVREEIRLLLRADRRIVSRAELPFFVFAPVAKDSRAGTLFVYADDELVCECPLYYDEDAPVKQVRA